MKYFKTRNCPKCNKELSYSCSSSYNTANKKGSSCKKCSNSLPRRISQLPRNSYVPLYDDNRTTYFYYLCNIKDGIPKYIGKTINPKSRISSHIRDIRNRTNHKTNWINKVISEGGEIEMVIIDKLIPDGTSGSGDLRWFEQ
jgi:hypothetical protein